MVTEAFAQKFRQLVPADAVFSRVATGLTFTEGPVWNHREGYLAWVDIIGDAIWKWVPGEGKTVIMSPSAHANGMTFDGEGPAEYCRLERPNCLADRAGRYAHHPGFPFQRCQAEYPQRHRHQVRRPHLLHRSLQRLSPGGPPGRGPAKIPGLRRRFTG